MAGRGTRLRPHTWSKPKQLVGVAGKTVLDHVLDTFVTLPNPEDIELVNIVGYLGDQIEAHMKNYHPHLKTNYVIQEEPLGQSHAIYLARKHLNGPLLVVFADTLIMTDLSFLTDEAAEAVIWVKPVEDPRRFGVAELDPSGWVTRLIEKPQDLHNNLAVVGFYYFKQSSDLLSAIDEQMHLDIRFKGEYFLADAINIMLKHGLKMRPQEVKTWLDAGTPESLLKTNHYLLENGCSNSQEAAQRQGVVIVPPVFVHSTAQVECSIIGPYVSLGAGCQVKCCIIKNSILEDEAQVSNVILEGSLLGRRAHLERRPGIINVGDETTITL